MIREESDIRMDLLDRFEYFKAENTTLRLKIRYQANAISLLRSQLTQTQSKLQISEQKLADLENKFNSIILSNHSHILNEETSL